MGGKGSGRKGFGSMSKERQREIASKGGIAAHQKGTAPKWTGGPNGTARAAGRKGGLAKHGYRGSIVEQTNVADFGDAFKKEI